MALDALKNANRVIGIKQVTKAVRKGIVRDVYVADNADERCLAPLIALCGEQAMELFHVDSMKELGEACGIEVGAAAAAVLKSSC
ncbi:MAG: ribosomal L7Ae/L30e/S12e/Gadd45 family protein [Selenomonadaceae bacterium]|nr:ribosomal L7Ae/L30e/S12e/Gadd45 family protein [Selenomonadaceae bacterium]